MHNDEMYIVSPAKALGMVLKRRRQVLGISQEKLSCQLDLPRISIANLERGNRRLSFDLLFLLAEVLETSVGQIIHDTQAVMMGRDPTQPYSADYSHNNGA
ncbi:hypothetical protein C4J81_03235 [Deltaproteobacteria bacterium Smac51]|nr:hypothetical protein C4J81_03235 [Deltaproteobacteria bacterium Smac51]